ncbi:MAG: hypothetical protein ABSA59_00550 [Terriglobia bacterium]|jgi:hypothetical protein
MINPFLLRVRVVVQFDVEAAESIPILSGRRHLVRQPTDKLAATTSNCTTTGVRPVPITA